MHYVFSAANTAEARLLRVRIAFFLFSCGGFGRILRLVGSTDFSVGEGEEWIPIGDREIHPLEVSSGVHPLEIFDGLESWPASSASTVSSRGSEFLNRPLRFPLPTGDVFYSTVAVGPRRCISFVFVTYLEIGRAMECDATANFAKETR
ncbi:hypothetical protein GWI33_001274 [Rhynchophorus ferrugineus]|uniref:Uncharacterized protein n=1 Tax=Rhynchophorus ferrugineus TaxID=354439 RepID=A0A834MLT4_RHYFE|nr:hypothetical protein GWI33_001274 [Rhynchophorus ferrugineus]